MPELKGRFIVKISSWGYDRKVIITKWIVISFDNKVSSDKAVFAVFCKLNKNKEC